MAMGARGACHLFSGPETYGSIAGGISLPGLR